MVKPHKILLAVTAISLSFGPVTKAEDLDESHKKSIGTGIGRALELFFSPQGLKAAVFNSGLRGNSANQVENVVKLALENLAGKENPTQREVLSALRSVSGSEDLEAKQSLLRIFRKNEADLTKGDFVEAVNNLVYLAGRYGLDNSLALACSACVSDSLSKSGFKFSYREIADKRINYILSNVIPKDSRKLSGYIKDQLGRNALSSNSNKSALKLSSVDEVNFALFLSIPNHGTSAQKDLFQAIKKISTRPDGSVEILDDSNPHRLWSLFSNDLNEEELSGWSRLLDSVAEEANKNGDVSKKDAFYRYFKKKADADPSLADRYEILRSKNCFFKN